MSHAHLLLKNNFLIPEFQGAKFVAWAGNVFDAYITASALVEDDEYYIRPYLTRNNSLRGFKVLLREDLTNKKAKGWEFLDGQAMIGAPGMKLEKFLENFAPDFPKLSDAIDFEKEEFDPQNRKHCDYAMRDSVGLWHGMQNAQRIMLERFKQPLLVTIGGACIRIFRRHIPEQVKIVAPDEVLERVLRQFVVRGGFCYCVRRYKGPVWKYDLNQAYAAAMREARLPCGESIHQDRGIHPYARTYIARITARHDTNTIPFYYRAFDARGKMCSLFSTREISETWLTCIEIEQLRDEGWNVNILESYAWQSGFTMTEYVGALESARRQAPGGPSGAQGTVIKYVGCNSYGKTLETLDPVEYVFSKDCPPGFVPFYPDGDSDPIEHIFARALSAEEFKKKDYHQPQIGAFITAHVRMVVRRAALLNPQAWLYADTDCVVFSQDVTSQLDIDPSRYGAWKVEESGAIYEVIAKKVYSEVNASKIIKNPDGSEDYKLLKRSAKGLNVKRLTPRDFSDWLEGEPPKQDQVQRNNFLKVLQGDEMFRAQRRRGTSVK